MVFYLRLNRQVRDVVRTAQVSPLPRLFDPLLELSQRLYLLRALVLCLEVENVN